MERNDIERKQVNGKKSNWAENEMNEITQKVMECTERRRDETEAWSNKKREWNGMERNKMQWKERKYNAMKWNQMD